MADDYLLEAALSGLEGFNRSFVPFIENKYKEDLLTKRAELEKKNQLELLKAKAPLELENKQRDITMREDSEKRIADYKSKLPDPDDMISGEDVNTFYPSLKVDPKRSYNKALLSGYNTQQRIGMSADDRDYRRDERRDKIILQVGEQIDRNPVIKSAREAGLNLEQVDKIIDLAKRGNTVSSSSIGIKTAKAMGEVGVLTDTDISRYVESGQLSRKAADKLSRWVAGKPTDATLQEIQEIGPVLRDSFNSKIQSKYDNYVNRLSRNMNIDPQEAARLLDVPYSGSSGYEETKVKGNRSVSEMTDEELLAELSK